MISIVLTKYSSPWCSDMSFLGDRECGWFTKVQSCTLRTVSKSDAECSCSHAARDSQLGRMLNLVCQFHASYFPRPLSAL